MRQRAGRVKSGFSGLQVVVREHLPTVHLNEIRSGIPGTPIQSWLEDDPWQERGKTGWKILLEWLTKESHGEIASRKGRGRRGVSPSLSDI